MNGQLLSGEVLVERKKKREKMAHSMNQRFFVGSLIEMIEEVV